MKQKIRRLIFIIIPSCILAVIVFLFVQIFVTKLFAKGALQVTTVPESKVYLNGTLIGKTPLCKCPENKDMVKDGEYVLRLEPEDKSYTPYEERITIVKSVLTVVDRRFGKGALSEGSTVSLVPISETKQAQLTVVTFPEKAEISIDDKVVGTGPILLKDLPAGDHAIKLRKTGYKEKIVRVHTSKGYQLQAAVSLSIDSDEAAEPTSVESNSPSSTSPTPTPSPKQVKVLILDTPTGFLRVRSDSSITSAQISQVKPGETYEMLSEVEGWFEIKLSDGQTGWINSQYATKQE